MASQDSRQDQKLDKLLEDVATIRQVTSQHTQDLHELKTKLEPVFFHVTGLRWAGRIVGVLVALVTIIATLIGMKK